MYAAIRSNARWTPQRNACPSSYAGSTSRGCWSATARSTSPSWRRSSLNSLAETLAREPLPREPLRREPWSAELVRTWAFAYRNVIMARRNVFFVFELTFWPGVAMLSHGLLTRFLHLDARMTAFILVGTVALSAVQVCQLDVAYAVLFDIWSKSMKHQFLTPIGVRHLAVGSWLVGVARGVVVFLLMAAI